MRPVIREWQVSLTPLIDPLGLRKFETIPEWLDLPFMSPIRNLAGTPMGQLGGVN